MNIKFLGKDQIWQEESTRYWFDVDGVNYCLEDTNGYHQLLDEEGNPIDDCNLLTDILNLLTDILGLLIAKEGS